MTDMGYQRPAAASVPAGCDDNPVAHAILLADYRVAAEPVPVRPSAVTVTVHPSLAASGKSPAAFESWRQSPVVTAPRARREDA